MSKGALGLLAAYWPEDTPRYAHVPLKTLAEVTVFSRARTSGAKTALISSAGFLTYAELAERVRRVAEHLRASVARGARVLLAAPDARELVIGLLGAIEAGALVYLTERAEPALREVEAFQPELIIAPAGTQSTRTRVISFDALERGEAASLTDRANYRAPVLVLPASDRRSELMHSHRSLVATAIAVASFYLLSDDVSVAMLEAPINWHTLGFLVAALHGGATVVASWETDGEESLDFADYAICTWATAMGFLRGEGLKRLPRRLGAGLVVAIEGFESMAARARLARRLGCDVLTLLGRNEMGPIIGSHPTWYLNDAVGIPLPNVDLRPLNPADGTLLKIGWEAVERAEIGVKSPLAPVGGQTVEGWLRTGVIAEIDPTGSYFLHRGSPKPDRRA